MARFLWSDNQFSKQFDRRKTVCWREESKRGRYEHAMWAAAGLEEPAV